MSLLDRSDSMHAVMLWTTVLLFASTAQEPSWKVILYSYSNSYEPQYIFSCELIVQCLNCSHSEYYKAAAPKISFEFSGCHASEARSNCARAVEMRVRGVTSRIRLSLLPRGWFALTYISHPSTYCTMMLHSPADGPWKSNAEADLILLFTLPYN